MNPIRSSGEISYAVEVIYDDRIVRQSDMHKCHAQLPCKCLARYQARPCLALRTALVHGKIPKPVENGISHEAGDCETAVPKTAKLGGILLTLILRGRCFNRMMIVGCAYFVHLFTSNLKLSIVYPFV